MRYPVWLGLFLVTSLLPLPLPAASPKWEPVTPAELAEDKPQIEPEAAAEILRYRLEIDDSDEWRRNYLKQTRIKIYDPGRAVDVTRLAWFWDGQPNDEFEIQARLTLPDGTSRLFDRHDLRERSVAERGHSNSFLGKLRSRSGYGIEEKFLAITGVVKGAVLDVWEWEPKVEKTDWHMSTIQRPYTPIRQFEYTSRYRPDKDIQHRSFVLNPCGGQMSHDDKAGQVRFVAQNLPSIRREPYAAPDTYFSLTIIETYENLYRSLDRQNLSVPLPDSVPLSLGPWAFFSTAQDFQDADKGYLTKRVKAKAGELVAGITDPRAKARRIYDYIQRIYRLSRSRVSVVSWTDGARSADELVDMEKNDRLVGRDERLYYYLFVALARAAGLECHSVFHPMRTEFPFRVDLVSDQFLSGHTLAVKIGESWVLCQPCSEVPLAFGALPWEIEGQLALMAMPRQQAFLNVPPLAPENSRAETAVELDLDAEGNLQGHCTRTLTGHAAHVVRERLRGTGQEDWWRLARSLLDLQNSSSEVRLEQVEGLESPEEPVRLHAALRWPAYAPVMGDRLMFVLAVWQEGRPPLLSKTTRTTPVFFRFPTVQSETITIHLPRGYRPGTLPKPITATSGDFSYSLAVSHDPGRDVLVVEHSTVNGAIDIPVADYRKARDWFQRVSVADQIGIVLSHPADGLPK